MTKTKSTPESRLATFWRRRLKTDWCDFDTLADTRQPPPKTLIRPRALSIKEMDPKPLADIAFIIAKMIAYGWPLSREEYYIALALGLLMGDRPYEEFFKQRWFESDEHRGYRNYWEFKRQQERSK